MVDLTSPQWQASREKQWQMFQEWHQEDFNRKALKVLRKVFFGEKSALDEPELEGLLKRNFGSDYQWYAQFLFHLRPEQNEDCWSTFFENELKRYCDGKSAKLFHRFRFNEFIPMSPMDVIGWDADTHLTFWQFMHGKRFNDVGYQVDGIQLTRKLTTDKLFIDWSARIHLWFSRTRIFQERYLIPDDNIYLKLKEYMLSTIAHLPDNAFEPHSPANDSWLINQFHNLLAYANDPEKYYVQDKSTVKDDPQPIGEARKDFFAQLKNDFDNKDLGEPFARLWEQVKSDEIVIPPFYG